MPAWEYVRRRALIDRLYGMAERQLAGVDAMLTPTVAITPPPVESLLGVKAYARANMQALRNTMIANFMGLCGLTLPVGSDSAGMPVGLQVMAGPRQEARLLAIGQSIEQHLGTATTLLGEPPTP